MNNCSYVNLQKRRVIKCREDELYDLAELFKGVWRFDQNRILFVLFEKDVCVCDLAETLNMTQSAISASAKDS